LVVSQLPAAQFDSRDCRADKSSFGWLVFLFRTGLGDGCTSAGRARVSADNSRAKTAIVRTRPHSRARFDRSDFQFWRGWWSSGNCAKSGEQLALTVRTVWHISTRLCHSLIGI